MSPKDQMLKTALDAGWPKVRIRPAEYVGGDEATWQAFAEHADEADLDATENGLQRLLDAGIRGWDARQSDAFDIDRTTAATNPCEASLVDEVFLTAESLNWPLLPLRGLTPCKTPEAMWKAYVTGACRADLLDARDALLQFTPPTQEQPHATR